MGRTDGVLAPSTESSAGGATDAWLVTRGLLGNAMISEQSGSDIMTPPPGTEVDETRQTANVTGEVLNRVKSWNEMVADDTIHIEVTTLSTYQFEVAFWLFPNHRKGCTMYQVDAVRSWSRAAERVLAQRCSGAAAGGGRGPAT